MSSWTPTPVRALQTPPPSATPIAEEEEYYSSWSLFLVCLLLILSLFTSYYLQIKRIRLIHETLVAIFAGMFVGLVVRLAPGTMIREMLVSGKPGMFVAPWRGWCVLEVVLTMWEVDVQAYTVLQPLATANHPQLWI